MTIEEIKQLLITKKKLLIIGSTVIVTPLIFLSLSLLRKDPTGSGSGSIDNPSVTEAAISGSIRKEIVLESVTPMDGQQNVSQGTPIVLAFKNVLPNEQVALTFFPEVTGTYNIDQKTKTVTFTPNPSFSSLTSYEVAVTIKDRSFTSPLNDTTTRYSWGFTTGEQEGESGYGNEDTAEYLRRREAAEKAYAARKEKMPFIIYLPYKTKHFSIEISALSDTLTVTTYGIHPDYHAAYKKEAIDWMKLYGANTDELQIVYKEMAP